MSDQDVVDLWLRRNLAVIEQKSQAHHLPIYAKWRRPMGLEMSFSPRLIRKCRMPNWRVGNIW